jgi:lysophospholipase L1-like esterase
MRICFFGDSFVNGTDDDSALGWPGRVVSTARRAGCDITFYNLGIRRDTSADILARWQQEAACRLIDEDTKGIAFSFGANDCAQDATGSRRVTLDQTLDNTRAILQAAQAIAPTVMIGPCPVLDDVTVDLRIRQLAKDMSAICAHAGVPYLDVFDTISTNAAWQDDARQGDGTHPNAAGYSALARHIEAWPAFRHWIGLSQTAG